MRNLRLPEEPVPSGAFHRRRQSARRATALLVCIFVMSITTIIVISMIDTQTLQMKALRHTQEYERSLYLAGSAVHHAMALLEDDPDLATPFSVGPIEFPAGSGNTYESSVVDSGDDLLITGTGISGNITRYVRVTVTR
jgi:hypothetical protein